MRRSLNTLLLSLALGLLAAGCGNKEDEPDTGTTDTGTTDTGDPSAAACTDEADPDIGTATEITDDIHSDGWFFVYMEDMHTDHDGSGDYTFMMQQSPPVPLIMLGPGVTGIDLGADLGFHDVEMAPDEGYQEDGTGTASLVIGTGWQDGGSGSQEGGFDMSEHVYVLRTAGDRFGKLELLQAENGEVTLRAYLQEDAGSCNLRTTE